MPLWDDSGKLMVPYTERMPIVGITVEAMESYCQYMTEQTGFAYRLPTALEWEKAARGVDGREYVWGNTFRKNAACLNAQDQLSNGDIPAEVGTHPEDRSVYGIYDMTGNARELVSNPGGWQYYTVKGSSFNLSESFARLAAHAYAFNLSDVGFRCAVSAPDEKNQ
jgi:formylglycine-generating enzyme required for sulfatase activity